MKTDYIIKEVSLDKVSKKYTGIVEYVRSQLISNLPNEIHSIYLYGSVATGKAKSPESDLDIVLILYEAPTAFIANRISHLQKSLTIKYQEIFREVGFAISNVHEVLHEKESYGWRFFLTVLSVRIFGDKLFISNDKFLPTRKLAKNLHSDIDICIAKAIEEIKQSNQDEANLPIKSIMKKIIRVAFSIVMEDAYFWTTDLEEMIRIFIDYYPDKMTQMNAVYNMTMIKYPVNDDALSILNNFGKWISSEFKLKVVEPIVADDELSR